MKPKANSSLKNSSEKDYRWKISSCKLMQTVSYFLVSWIFLHNFGKTCSVNRSTHFVCVNCWNQTKPTPSSHTAPNTDPVADVPIAAAFRHGFPVRQFGYWELLRHWEPGTGMGTNTLCHASTRSGCRGVGLPSALLLVAFPVVYKSCMRARSRQGVRFIRLLLNIHWLQKHLNFHI